MTTVNKLIRPYSRKRGLKYRREVLQNPEAYRTIKIGHFRLILQGFTHGHYLGKGVWWTGHNGIKLFTSIIYGCLCLSLACLSSLVYCLQERPDPTRVKNLSGNKSGTNTLAYYEDPQITDEKSFITLWPDWKGHFKVTFRSQCTLGTCESYVNLTQGAVFKTLYFLRNLHMAQHARVISYNKLEMLARDK